MRILRIVTLLIVTTILGCTTLKTPYDQSFFESEMAKKGENSFMGKAFAKTGSGMLISTAGETAHLWPVHLYTTEWWIQRTKHHSFAKNLDERIYQTTRNAKVTDTNAFLFKNVPDGEYYVWIQMERYLGGTQSEILFWGKKINLKGGEQKKAILDHY